MKITECTELKVAVGFLGYQREGGLDAKARYASRVLKDLVYEECERLGVTFLKDVRHGTVHVQVDPSKAAELNPDAIKYAQSIGEAA